jgi:hypothetical protein
MIYQLGPFKWKEYVWFINYATLNEGVCMVYQIGHFKWMA